MVVHAGQACNQTVCCAFKCAMQQGRCAQRFGVTHGKLQWSIGIDNQMLRAYADFDGAVICGGAAKRRVVAESDCTL